MSVEINDERPLVKINARDNNKVIVQEVNNQVKISGWGPQGATGPVGPIGPTGPQGESGKYTISETAPTANLEQGDLWFRSSTAQLYFYYDGYWIETSTSYAGPQGEQGEPGTFTYPVDTAFTVQGGTLGTQPTFNGAPLFTGSYIRSGSMVHFRIDVDFDNITSFGTGQYYIDLPFPAKYNYLFRNACLHDVSRPRQYGLSGHIEAGQSRMLLFYTDTSGQDYAFDYNSPSLLTVNDNFHISGDYITDSA
jgi:hypothetical protein